MVKGAFACVLCIRLASRRDCIIKNGFDEPIPISTAMADGYGVFTQQ